MATALENKREANQIEIYVGNGDELSLKAKKKKKAKLYIDFRWAY